MACRGPADRIRPWGLQPGRFGGPVWRLRAAAAGPAPAEPLPRCDPLPYTEAEYAAYLASPGWSRAETDYLLGLCAQHNNRFAIVADRYDPAYGRSLVDLMERFHDIENALKVARGAPPDAKAFWFDAEWERKRRLQTESFQARSQAELQEELFLQASIEQAALALPRILQAREALMLVYGSGAERITSEGIPLTLGDILGGTLSRRRSVQAGAAKPSSAPGAATPRRDRKKSLSIAPSAQPSRAQSTDSVAPASVGPGRKPKPQTYPTSLASTKLTPIRVGLCRHVDRMLLDYGVPPRPTAATPAVIAKYDELRGLLAELADAKKALEALGPQATPGQP